ncbi:MAG: UDP-N-acetylmuramate--L-alanine ligase [Tenacibaculum sp.]
MNLSEAQNIYFIGIGGIGMSALAQYFVLNGKNVAGYDKTKTPLTDSLIKLGIILHYNDNISSIPVSYFNKQNTVIVYTPAVFKNHTELVYFKTNNYTVLKRAEALAEITKNSFCLAVAGTHGKTTSASILGHIMQTVGASAFLGGIAENYNSNLILGKNNISVVEADEYDRSFLKLSPNIACITSTDTDHLDCYSQADNLLQSFKDFASQVSNTLLVAETTALKKHLTYGFSKKAHYRVFDLKVNKGTYVFCVHTPSKIIKDLKFCLPGKHNLMNALAALAMADIYGISSKIIRQQLNTFKGVQRRFSYKIKTKSVVLIDDYAHHPTEINAVYNSVKEMHPKQKILAVFQPHLFSRTQYFADEFAKALSKFDQVILLDIYAAREHPIKGISSIWLLDKIKIKNKKLCTKENLDKNIIQSKAKVIVIMGAGDIGLLVNPIKSKLKEKYNL